MKSALITGANGQDGSYLSELLLDKDYHVFAMVRRSSVNTLDRISHLLDNDHFHIVEGDICDPSSVNSIIRTYKPDEVYNLAAQSHVATSFEQPTYTFQVDAVGVLNLLEGIRHISPTTKFYQASTSEMFGANYSMEVKEEPYLSHGGIINRDFPLVKFQDENTPFSARSPYAVAKIAAHNLVRLYREAYGVFACAGILFNHESPRRGENFVTRKITRYIGRLAKYLEYNRPEGVFACLELGNLDAKRDWGHAKDYVRAMYLMMQHDKPDDFVIATGKSHTVRDFLIEAFCFLQIDYSKYVQVNPKFFRPSDVEFLQGRADKARKILGWEPTVSFRELVQEMTQYDVEKALAKTT